MKHKTERQHSNERLQQQHLSYAIYGARAAQQRLSKRVHAQYAVCPDRDPEAVAGSVCVCACACV